MENYYECNCGIQKKWFAVAGWLCPKCDDVYLNDSDEDLKE